LFLIPLLIAAGVIGVMLPISRLAGGDASLEQALADLKRSGGERTADVLVGPGAKQRYLAAQIVSVRMKEMMENGMGEGDRVRLADQLLDVLENHTRAGEGEVQHFVLLALGRVWQVDPQQPAMDSAEAVASRRRVLDALLKPHPTRDRPAYVDAAPADHSRGARAAAESTRKAAVLALGFWRGRPEVREAIPVLVRKLTEDDAPDVRFAAASALGPIATREDARAVEALLGAMRGADRNQSELSWAAAGSLAQMNVPDCKDVILMLLDRNQLAELEYYDREADPDNPRARRLGEEERQRVLINTMQCAVGLDVAEVRERLKAIAEADPSPRVRAAGKELLEKAGGR
jgi:hypothetical protein